jgi:type I restriction enzyme S subunit
MMDEIEGSGGNEGIVIDDKRDWSMVRYRATGKKGEHAADLRKWLGEERFTKLDHLIKVLSDLKTHSAEAIATLYAVWNDALIEGKLPTDDQIVSAFFGWHPKKGDNFRADELPHWLDWMRRHGIVPTGSGPKTMSQMGTLV